MAAKLTGYKIDIKSECQAKESGDFIGYDEEDYENYQEFDEDELEDLDDMENLDDPDAEDYLVLDKENQEELSSVEAKAEALKKAMDDINKKMKTVAVMRMGDLGRLDIPSVPTGILPLDVALGIGGLPRGRIVEIYGPEASGKTTVTLHMIAEAQKLGGTAVFIDAEHALDPTYAKKLGVNLDELIISQPDNGEQGLEVADKLISSGAVDLIVIDSVAALVPKAEIDGEMGDLQVGLHARMMSKAMRKLAGTISKTGTIAVFINQLREKVGVMYGNPEVTTGGRALKFYASMRIDVRRIEQLKSSKNRPPRSPQNRNAH